MLSEDHSAWYVLCLIASLQLFYLHATTHRIEILLQSRADIKTNDNIWNYVSARFLFCGGNNGEGGQCLDKLMVQNNEDDSAKQLPFSDLGELMLDPTRSR